MDLSIGYKKNITYRNGCLLAGATFLEFTPYLLRGQEKLNKKSFIYLSVLFSRKKGNTKNNQNN